MSESPNKPFRIDFSADRALYRNTLRLTKTQAASALVYSLAGVLAGLVMIGGSLWVLAQDLRTDGPLIVVALCLPFWGWSPYACDWSAYRVERRSSSAVP